LILCALTVAHSSCRGLLFQLSSFLRVIRRASLDEMECGGAGSSWGVRLIPESG
jgi:hypothetical protein